MNKNILIACLVIISIGIIAFGSYYLAGGKNATVVKKQFSNGQEYVTYTDDHFSVNYPEWKTIDTSKMPESEKIKVSVSNEKCSLFVKVKAIASELSLDDYTKKVIGDFGKNLTVNISEVIGNEAKLDADIDMGNGGLMRNVSRVFRIGDTLYSVVFVGAKADFSATCEPIVNEVIGSVRVK
jgi:hypothetical protein